MVNKKNKRKFTMVYWDIMPFSKIDDIPLTAIYLFLIIADLIEGFGSCFITLTTLADRLLISPRTVNRLLKRLEEKDWICFEKEDGRKRSILLTSKGDDIYRGQYNKYTDAEINDILLEKYDSSENEEDEE